jgi:hypothetical protein
MVFLYEERMTPMQRGSIRWHIFRVFAYVCVPIVLVIRFVFSGLYSIFFAWWLTDILANRTQQEFTGRVRAHLDYLFVEHGAKVVPNEGNKTKPGIYFKRITVAAEGVRLCLTEWRGEIRVHAAPVFAPAESFEISAVLMVVVPEKWPGQRPTYIALRDFANLLYPRWEAVREAFSEEHYPEVREKLAEVHDRETRMTGRLEDRINRGLYSG